MNRVKTFFADEDGTTATEYAIMLSLILMVIISTVGTLGSSVNSSLTNTATKL